jgi:guanylate kinase
VTTPAAERGRLIVVAAPSGAGKTTLVRALLDRVPDLEFSISHTTREPRPSEHNGRDYFFVDDETFVRMVGAGEFLEHAEVFDHRYGTSKAAVEELRARGRTVLLEIDWQGAQQVRQAAPDAETVFIVPPSVAELEIRLRGRGTDSEDVIARRLRDSVSDLRHWDEFDYIVVNDELQAAIDAMAAIVAGDGDDYRTDSDEVRRIVEDILAGHDRLQ